MTTANGKSSRVKFTIGAIVLVAIVGITAGIVLWQTIDAEYTPEYGEYQNAAISCDAPYCADIGKSMLLQNGSVADAAIATLLCMGAVHSMSMGIGGGFLMVLYNATSKTSRVLNARETAPQRATENMFQGNASWSARGPLAVAVPGEIKGYWELHQAAGKLPWADLFQPTIDLCKNGFNVSWSLANALTSRQDMIAQEPTLQDILINNKTGEVFKENETMTRPILAQTLEKIATRGGEDFYKGEIAELLFSDLKGLGGIMELEDLEQYE